MSAADLRGLRGWLPAAGAGVLVPLVLDAYAGELAAAGRVFLAVLVAYHLLIVPGRVASPRGAGDILEAGVLALAALPLAEVVRGMTGAPGARLPWVVGCLFACHLTGRLAGRVAAGRPGFLRHAYWPLLLLVGCGLPLVAYAGREFFGVDAVFLGGAPLVPVVCLLDGGG